MAERNVSFDLLAIDKASEALAKVGREVSDLGDKVERASGTVNIDADTAKAREQVAALDAQLGRLNAKGLRVDANISAAERQLAILQAELQRTTDEDAQVEVRANIAQAEAELRRLKAERISIDLDTNQVSAKAARVRQEIEQATRAPDPVPVDIDPSRWDGKLQKLRGDLDRLKGDSRGGFDIDVDVSGAVAGLGRIAALLTAIIPLAAAAAGAVAGIGAVGAVGFAGVAAGFSGIGDALKAMGDQASSGGAAVKVSAEAIRSATRQVEAAQRDLVQAQRDVATAQRDAERADRDVISAHKDLTNAERDATRAEADLTGARRDAIRTLEDYRTRTSDMALSQKDAALSVREAEARLAEVMKDGNSTQLERERAALSVEQAQQRQKDLTIESNRLQEDKNEADRKGVDGSAQVVSAQDRIAQANDRVEQAKQRVSDAEQRQRDAQQKIIDAQEKVALATQRVADAQLHLQEVMHPEPAAAGVDKLAEAMGKLGPKAQEFVKFMREFLDGPVKDLRQAGQEAFLPGIQSGLERLKPLMKEIQPAWAAFSGTLGKALGDLIPLFGQLAAPFLRFADASLKGLAPLGGVLQAFVTQLGGVFDELTRSGTAQAAMQALVEVIGAILPILPELIRLGADLAVQVFPLLAQVVRELAPLVIELVKALGPLLVEALKLLIPLIHDLVQFLVDHPEVLQGLVLGAMALAVAMGPLGEIIGTVVGVLSGISAPVLIAVGVIAALAAGIKYAWDNSESFRQKVGELWQALQQAFQTIKDSAEPAIRDLVGTIQKDVVPAFAAFVEAMTPVITFIVEHLAPIIATVFGGIIQVIDAAFKIIAGIFNVFAGIFTGDWQRVWDGVKQIFSGLWEAIKAIVTTALDLVKKELTTLWDEVKVLWGRITDTLSQAKSAIGRLASGMWDGIWNAFRSMINKIIDGWNSLHFSIPGFDVGPAHFGGFTLGVPQLPHLAKGGITRGPTLAIVGDNPGGRELIEPLPPGGVPGRGVTVEVHLHGVMAGDEDSFGRAVISALVAGVNTGVLPRTLLPAY